MNEGISVVICCYNSAGKITPTLQHLLKQELSEPVGWEVILVDNASEDNTTELARQLWTSKEVPLKIVPETRKGLSNARQTGIQESRYELVCFIDDDNWVDTHWIENVYRRMKQYPNVALLGGQGEVVFEKDEPEWFQQFKNCYAIGPQAKNEGIMESRTAFLYGAGLTMRKDVWNSILERGFQFFLSDRSGNNLTSGGDTEMCYAIRLAGHDLYYDPQLTFKHYMPAGRMTLDYLIKLAEAFGRSSVITAVYKEFLNKTEGFQKWKTKNYFISLLKAIYSYLLSLPKAMLFKSSKSVLAIKASYSLAYNYGCLSEKIRFRSNYSSVYKTIRDAPWNLG